MFRGCCLMVLVLGMFLICEGADRLRFITENSPPYNYEVSNRVTGLAVELVQIMGRDLGREPKIEVLPWSEGYSLALQETNVVLFTTVLDERRRDKFKWVGPVGLSHQALFSKKGVALTNKQPEYLRGLGRVAAVHAAAPAQAAAAAGFDVETYPSLEVAVEKFLQGKDFFLAANEDAVAFVMRNNGLEFSQLENVLSLRCQLMYLAFSSGTADATVKKWQGELDLLKKNGTLDKLYQDWLPYKEAPGVIQVFTEDSPPITYLYRGKVMGWASDVVREILKRLELPDRILLLPWVEVYRMALINPNVALFTVTRTPARENLFHWIGPIGGQRSCLYARKGSGIKINRLEDAADVGEIGVISGWFIEEYLQAKGITNLTKGINQPRELVDALMKKEVGLIALTDLTISQIMKSSGYSLSDIEKVYTIKRDDFYIAISRGTDTNTVARWQSVFDQLKFEGVLDNVVRRAWKGGL